MNAPLLIPDHTLLRPIGRGAYGEVWLARNVMGALRAVKVIRRDQFESERPYEREFAGIQRYEPVSRSSSGLVHLLHVGRNDTEGYFYYVMELADGVSAECGVRNAESAAAKDASAEYGTRNAEPKTTKDLDAESNTGVSTPHSALDTPHSYLPRTLRSDLQPLGRLPTADCLRLALDVVSGLAQLHVHDLVHRDVKPGNIIFVNGRAKLADIGLVTTHGESRTFVGTEGYIPPEGPGEPTADLYALGIVLYEASTGYAPERFPDVPHEWFADPAGDDALEFHEVILKACEGQRERRYQSAEEMQADLALLQSGQSVRRVRALERRYVRLRASGVVGTTLLMCAIVAALFANYRARVAAESHAKETALREHAEMALARAKTAERESQQQLYTALLEQARATVHSAEMGQRVQTLDAIRRAAAISNTVELRRGVFAALALPDLRFERELSLDPEVNYLHLDPSFERLATIRGKGPVEICAVSDGRLLATLPASTNLESFLREWSADGRFLAVKRDYDTGGRRSDWEVWEMTGPRRVLLLRDVSYNAISFHPRLPHLIASRRTKGVATWNLEDGRELVRFPRAGAPDLVRFSPEGERFAAVSLVNGSIIVSVHDATNPETTELASHAFNEFVNTIAWHPGGQWLAVPDHSGDVHCMNVQTGEIEFLGRHKWQAVRAVFSPDGAYLFTGGWGSDLICWDAQGKRRAFTISLNSDLIQVSADGRRCAVPSKTGVQLYAFERPAAHREFAEDLGGRLRKGSFSTDGRWLAASASKRGGVWDLSGGGPGVIDTNTYDTHFFFTADGRELFGSRGNQGDTACFRWRMTPATNPAAPPELTRLPLSKPQGFTFLCLNSNSVVITSSKGSQILAPKEIEAGSSRWAATIPGHTGVSPDGRWLGVHRPFSTSLYVYSLPGFEQVAKLTRSTGFGDFQFSPLGDEMALTSFHVGAVADFWNTTTWEHTRALTNFCRLLYTPDARALWLTKDFRTAGLYDAHTLEPLLLLPTGMLPLAVSPDGRRVAMSVDERWLQMWDLTALRGQFQELGLDWAAKQ